MVSTRFARAYTAGTVFHGFIAAAKGGPYDANPLRDDAESAAADAIGDQEVREVQFGRERGEYFVSLGGSPIEGIGRYLDFNRAQSVAAAAGARLHIVVPLVKAVTAETVIWEPVPFETPDRSPDLTRPASPFCCCSASPTSEDATAFRAPMPCRPPSKVVSMRSS
jgi:hypothetical protein